MKILRSNCSCWLGSVSLLSSAALCFACAGDSAGTSSGEGSAVGGSPSTAPGNEAIPDIGQLPKGGASAVGATTSVGTIGGSSSALSGTGGNADATGGATGSAATNGGTTGASGGTNPIAMGGTTGASGGTNATTTAPAAYHDVASWTSSNQHGLTYFLANAQKDEHGIACTSCHGANLQGSGEATSCTSCHSKLRDCSFCHGTGPSQSSPPAGVWGETATSTLGVGRHAAHLSASSSHAAFACSSCHTNVPAGDLTHALAYKPSTDLSTAGHHGDVTFSGLAAGMTWNVNTTTGTPVTARGTCLGACHSNGRGGNPAKIPYWAGGTWTSGCTNCHGNPPSTGSHSDHRNYACSECHAGASSTAYSSSNHFNGKRDYASTRMPYSNGQCSGSCHGSEAW